MHPWHFYIDAFSLQMHWRDQRVAELLQRNVETARSVDESAHRGAPNYDEDNGTYSAYQSPRQRPRRGHAPSAKPSQTEQERNDKQEMRLIRLGFFDNTLPTQDELEKAYTSRTKRVKNSSSSSEDKEFQIKKLKSAFTNISKAKHGRVPSPSTDDDEKSLLDGHKD